jgi:DNA-binding transcriptional regulator YiaG
LVAGDTPEKGGIPLKKKIEFVTGNFIKAVRKRFGLTQYLFAKELGTNQWHIYRMEKYGSKMPRVHEATRIYFIKAITKMLEKYKNL